MHSFLLLYTWECAETYNSGVDNNIVLQNEPFFLLCRPEIKIHEHYDNIIMWGLTVDQVANDSSI